MGNKVSNQVQKTINDVTNEISTKIINNCTQVSVSEQEINFDVTLKGCTNTDLSNFKNELIADAQYDCSQSTISATDLQMLFSNAFTALADANSEAFNLQNNIDNSVQDIENRINNVIDYESLSESIQRNMNEQEIKFKLNVECVKDDDGNAIFNLSNYRNIATVNTVYTSLQSNEQVTTLVNDIDNIVSATHKTDAKGLSDVINSVSGLVGSMTAPFMAMVIGFCVVIALGGGGTAVKLFRGGKSETDSPDIDELKSSEVTGIVTARDGHLVPFMSKEEYDSLEEKVSQAMDKICKPQSSEQTGTDLTVQPDNTASSTTQQPVSPTPEPFTKVPYTIEQLSTVYNVESYEKYSQADKTKTINDYVNDTCEKFKIKGTDKGLTKIYTNKKEAFLHKYLCKIQCGKHKYTYFGILLIVNIIIAIMVFNNMQAIFNPNAEVNKLEKDELEEYKNAYLAYSIPTLILSLIVVALCIGALNVYYLRYAGFIIFTLLATLANIGLVIALMIQY